jgi:hypothetical protein
VRDSNLLNRLHRRWRSCALCGRTWPTSLHHINKHPKDDVEGNLVMLCGSGTTLCHGAIEGREKRKLRDLATYIRSRRPDTLAYLDERFPEEGAEAWLQRVVA